MNSRTDTYELARAYLATYYEANQALPTGRELARWFEETHDSRPSASTIHKAINAFRQSLVAQGTPVTDDNDPAKAWAASIKAQADAAAASTFRVQREALEAQSREQIDAAEARAKAAEQALAQVLEDTKRQLRDADIRETELRRNLDVERAAETERAQRDQALMQTLHAQIASLSAQVQVAEAATRHEAEARRIERENSQAAYDTLRAERTREQSEALQREQRSDEQFKASQALWLKEIAGLREKVTSLEKALLAASVAKDEAVKETRREIVDSLAAQLKALAESVGGVNQVHNVHMGGLRTQLEETIGRLDQITALLRDNKASSPPPLVDQTKAKRRQ